jgi:UDP-glucose 4-epimerase
MKQRILVTGGAGFIGSHLVDLLLRRGTSVSVLDDLSTGSRTNLPRSTLVDFRHGDARDPRAVRAAAEGAQAMVHLAALVSVQRCVEDPAASRAQNLEATQVVLDCAKQLGIGRLVFASSAAVYGPLAEPPTAEDAATAPETPYGEHKLASEQAGAAFAARGATFTALRFFNVYGPRQDPGSPYSGVIARFCDAARSGVAPVVFGTGRQTRDFVFVGDVVEAVSAALDADVPGCRTYNVGSGVETSLLDLLQVLGTLTPMPTPRFAEARAGEVARSAADVAAIRADLGWSARIGLGQGLRATLDQRGRS